MYTWQMNQTNWENKLDENHDDILMETKMSHEKLLKVIEVLQKYDVMAKH